jgi:hypothetical protein
MLGTDLRNATRAMRKQPFFAAIAVATLGLGIGANTAIFSVVHTVLLEPVPYPAEEADEVLVIAETHQRGTMSVAYPNFKDWQRSSRSFEAMAGFRETLEPHRPRGAAAHGRNPGLARLLRDPGSLPDPRKTLHARRGHSRGRPGSDAQSCSLAEPVRSGREIAGVERNRVLEPATTVEKGRASE